MTSPMWEPRFLTQWEREDYERQQRGEPPLGPLNMKFDRKAFAMKHRTDYLESKVIDLMQASSCFGRETCPTSPCACARSLIDAIAKSTPAISHQVALALWQGWMELNEIVARDGVPYTHMGGKASVAEDYFRQVKDDLATAYQNVTGKAIQPWPPMPEQPSAGRSL